MGEHGQERVIDELDLNDRDVKLVTLATQRATQAVARMNRHRLMWTGLLIGLVIGGIIGGVVGSYVSAEHGAETRRLAHGNSLANCRAAATVRPQGNARAFDEIAYLNLLQDALLPKVPADPRTAPFAAAELRQINALAEGHVKGQPRWRSFTAVTNAKGEVTGNELPDHITGFDQLARTIKPVPLINCQSLLGR